MKPAFTFAYADQPEFKTVESRAYIVNSIRAMRRQPARYTVKRVSRGTYTATLNYPGAPVAILQAVL